MNWDLAASDLRNTMYNLKSDKDGKLELQRLAKGILSFEAFANGNYRHTRFAIPTDAVDTTCVLRSNNEPVAPSILVLDSSGKPAPRQWQPAH